MAHTPGPWIEVDAHELPKRGHTVRAIKAGKKYVATIDGDITNCRGVRGDYSMFCDIAEGWENSRLIAAAPEMLDFIESLVENGCDCTQCQAARAVIAKAKGE